MNRLVPALLGVLIVLVAVHGYLVWDAGRQAHDDAERQACLQKLTATGVFAQIDPLEGAAADDLQTYLADQLDAC